MYEASDEARKSTAAATSAHDLSDLARLGESLDPRVGHDDVDAADQLVPGGRHGVWLGDVQHQGVGGGATPSQLVGEGVDGARIQVGGNDVSSGHRESLRHGPPDTAASPGDENLGAGVPHGAQAFSPPRPASTPPSGTFDRSSTFFPR